MTKNTYINFVKRILVGETWCEIQEQTLNFVISQETWTIFDNKSLRGSVVCVCLFAIPHDFPEIYRTKDGHSSRFRARFACPHSFYLHKKN